MAEKQKPEKSKIMLVAIIGAAAVGAWWMGQDRTSSPALSAQHSSNLASANPQSASDGQRHSVTLDSFASLSADPDTTECKKDTADIDELQKRYTTLERQLEAVKREADRRVDRADARVRKMRFKLEEQQVRADDAISALAAKVGRQAASSTHRASTSPQNVRKTASVAAPPTAPATAIRRPPKGRQISIISRWKLMAISPGHAIIKRQGQHQISVHHGSTVAGMQVTRIDPEAMTVTTTAGVIH